MATRPWVLPADVIAYTTITAVAERSAERLAFDIARAEIKVISKTNNDFASSEKYPTIPEPIKMAVILLAEAYAKNAVEGAKEKQFKSETFDDYAYTVESGTVDIDDLGIDDLLSEYVIAAGKGKAVVKLRKL